jgi:hypothetical protein
MSLTITGVLTMILTRIVGDALPAHDVAAFINVAGFLIGAAVAYYGRFRQGDIEWWGVKK